RAMVSLKGRSAYLKTFTDEVCSRILEKIDCDPAQENKMRINCSGGKFYLQVPDTHLVRQAIEEVRLETEKTLWDEHKGQLSMNIAYVPFCYEGDQVTVGQETGEIGILWKHITEKFNALKNKKFKRQLFDDYEDFFEVQKVGGEDAKVCQITGIEGAVEFTSPFKDDDEPLCVLKSVKAQIDRGVELSKSQGIKMLEEYADDSYLGILRMDVDNLGTKIIRGFESMEKYRRFSSALEKFFDAEKGDLSAIQKKCQNFLHIVYAGGDDIFAVGRWDKVIEFAEEVNKEFKKFCVSELHDPDLSISGGVAIVNPRFPIAKAAEMAGEAEDAAKKYNDGKKNAFNLFGESVAWTDSEFGYVKNYKNQFVELINKEGLSRSILHKIKSYAAIVKDNQLIEAENKKGNTKRKPNMNYMWHTAYYLTRYMGKEKGMTAVKAFCMDLRDKQLHTPEQFRLMSLAARWAELELRETQQNNNQ
ncbi:hypothetical protein, partial [Bacteroides heparinolyticus]|uniref:type III-A CRISPR-associated protein Cas10/Csm1 n=1 Tax=Prevotella heparinolytica TaxID=28113 RepID=UPI00359F8BC6